MTSRAYSMSRAPDQTHGKTWVWPARLYTKFGLVFLFLRVSYSLAMAEQQSASGLLIAGKGTALPLKVGGAACCTSRVYD